MKRMTRNWMRMVLERKNCKRPKFGELDDGAEPSFNDKCVAKRIEMTDISMEFGKKKIVSMLVLDKNQVKLRNHTLSQKFPRIEVPK